MDIFLDTAEISDIKKAAQTGLIDGITTNPSLVAKSGQSFHEVIREICEIVQGPTSAEVIATDHEGMIREGEELAKISPHVVVKVPLTEDGLKACRKLRDENIEVNVTLCFSVNQALLAAKAGASYISPFVGRVDDIGGDGLRLVEEIVEVYDVYGFETKVLAASIRHAEHMRACALLGVDVATIPTKIFYQLYEHPQTDSGLQKFLADWKKVSS